MSRRNRDKRVFTCSTQGRTPLHSSLHKRRAGHGRTDAYIMPRDTRRLELDAASMGMAAAMIDYPLLKEGAAVERAARIASSLLRRISPSITNDVQAYTVAFVPAYAALYRLQAEGLAQSGYTFAHALCEQMLAHGANLLAYTSSFIEAQMKMVGTDSVATLVSRYPE